MSQTLEPKQQQSDQPQPKYNVLGTRPIRHDGADKVTGKAIYTADVHLPNMASGKIVRSPHPHAKILSIDASRALQLPGVLAVVTSQDLPDLKDQVAELGEGTVNLAHLGANVLAHEKALYRGHAVAAVAAKDVHTAEAAAKLIDVEYEVLPHTLCVLGAMEDDAPLLHDDIFTDEMGQQSERASNVSSHFHFEKGDVEQGFAEADVIVEREFRSATVHQDYIEPHVSVANWREDGRLQIWTATQGSFSCRHQVAELLRIPIANVNVTPCEIGGGFGGKIAVYLEPVAALLSKKSGRPVKIAMQRDEVFEGSGPTPGSAMRVKLGATKEGRLVAGEAWLAFEAGAYPRSPIAPACMCVFSCYDLPHGKVDGYDVLVNKPKSSAYRAPGATQAAFACETVVDEICEQLGADPLEFRLNNAAKEGVRRVDGPVYPRIGLVECLEAAKNSEHWNTPLEGPNRGRGLASGFWFGAGLKSSVTASVNHDGSVNLTEGSTDIGGTRTSIAMQFAEALGIGVDQVIPQVVDTDSIGYTDVTGGSRVTFATGLAAYHTALDIQKQMIERAAALWDCDPAEVVAEGGEYRANGHSMSFSELAAKTFKTGEPVVGRATVAPASSTNGFGVHLVDLEVDPETGKTTILRFTAIQDAGKAVHPSYVEGQMQGGAVQGIGWALNEEYFYDAQGRMRNASLLDYRMPTTYDLPMIDTIIVETANPEHPYGVRGVGETPIVPPPAAIANAIHQAVGVRMQELPMSPPKVWRAVRDQSASA